MSVVGTSGSDPLPGLVRPMFGTVFGERTHLACRLRHLAADFAIGRMLIAGSARSRIILANAAKPARPGDPLDS
jgi:hypothetical protein